MAISNPTVLFNTFTNTNGATLASPSAVSLVAGRLYIAYVCADHGTGDTIPGFTITGTTGGAGDWSSPEDLQFGDDNGIGARMYLCTVTETVTLTMNSNQGNQSCLWFGCVEIASGFDTADPCDEANSTGTSTLNATSGNGNLVGAPASGSLSLIFAANQDNSVALTPGGSLVELSETTNAGTGSDSGNVAIAYQNPGAQNQSYSNGQATSDWGILHLEIKQAADVQPKAPDPVTLYQHAQMHASTW